jgi:hypothetical protein
MKNRRFIAITLLSLIGTMEGQQSELAGTNPAPTAGPQVSDLIWNRDLDAGSALPLHRIQTIEQQNGLFHFELELHNDGQRVLSICERDPEHKFPPQSIVDLSKALNTFLDAVASRGVDFAANTRRIYMTAIPVEVQSRIADQLLATKAWRKHPVAHLNDAIAKSNPYREIDEVLRKHKLRITGCWADEEIGTKKMAVPGNASVKMSVPVMWGETEISLEPE